MPRLNQFLIAMTTVLACSCSASGPTISSGNSVTRFDAFQLGNIRLDCNIGCSMKFGANSIEIENYFKNSDWYKLSARVMEIGYGNDLTYFYLGRAAEGLGFSDGAKAYYLLSQGAAKCSTMFENVNCHGHKLPFEAMERQSILDAVGAS